ncbi:MAG: hypothetical protein JSS69_08125 [Acidobacteria bacterium]|nr:hypothetical protein [Acidobacteriota bacterium]MBS1865870.1 hypothetical protein [Acidobacteriota bacterium]
MHFKIFSGLGNNEKKSALEVEPGYKRVNGGRLDTTQDMEFCVASTQAETGNQFRGQAGAADGKEGYIGEAFRFERLRQAGYQLAACLQVVGQIQPAQNLRSEFSLGTIGGPEGEITSPESRNDFVAMKLSQLPNDFGGKGAWLKPLTGTRQHAPGVVTSLFPELSENCNSLN